MEVRRLNPNLSTARIEEDISTVNLVYSVARERYARRGFTDGEVAEGVLGAWRDLRAQQPTADVALTPPALLKQFSSYGLLVIKSNPSGASVEISGRPQNRQTEVMKWLPPGEYAIRLSKPGYAAVSDTCVVREEDKTEVVKELPPAIP